MKTGTNQCSREYVYYVFSDFKKRDFCWFLKMRCQKVVKSRYQKFSPQSFEVITVIHKSLSLIFAKTGF